MSVQSLLATPLSFVLVVVGLCAGCSGAAGDPPEGSPAVGPDRDADGGAPGGDTPAGGDAPAADGTVVARVTVRDPRPSGGAQSDVVVTFGHPFGAGALPAGRTLVARTAAGAPLPTQVDVGATHADGSARHAIVTVIVPHLDPTSPLPLELVTAQPASGAASVELASAFPAGADATIDARIGATTWTAALRTALDKAEKPWLHGPLVTEARVTLPLSSADGSKHPHLTARFDVRVYAGGKRARVSVGVENDWAYRAGPSDFTYDARVTVGDQRYDKGALEHHHHARWRKVLSIGELGSAFVRLDPAALIATGAVTHYDTTTKVAESYLAELGKTAAFEPMEIGLAARYMPETGGRPDIGPLPGWSAAYLLSMDPRAFAAMIATAEGSSSWSMHYRDEVTDRPLSVADHPYASLLGNPGDMVDPKTGRSDQFPACAGPCTTPYTSDSAHQPSLVYLPYLVTGDRWYLEELQFWAAIDVFESNPGYREHDQGLLHSNQVRGQAWSLRSVGEAAWITPKSDPLAAYFDAVLRANLAYYTATLAPGGAAANALGYLEDHALAYADGRGIAPWQDDFFTWSVGRLVELGYDEARPVLAYKARFPIGRMTAPGYCWVDGAPYFMVVRDASGKPYATFAEAYDATLGDPTDSKGDHYRASPCGSQAQADWRTQNERDQGSSRSTPWSAGEMTGYADGAEGYPSNLQPALAMAATSGVAGGKEAWDVFMARTVKPDYGVEPQFAIVPRPAK